MPNPEGYLKPSNAGLLQESHRHHFDSGTARDARTRRTAALLGTLNARRCCSSKLEEGAESNKGNCAQRRQNARNTGNKTSLKTSSGGLARKLATRNPDNTDNDDTHVGAFELLN